MGSLVSEGDHAVKLVTETEWSNVMNLDRKFFETDHSWLLAEILLNNRNKSWYVEREGKMTVYLLGRSGSNYRQLRLLSAEIIEDDEMLLLSALNDFSGRPVLLDILQDKTNLKEFLLPFGLNVKRLSTRMYLKDNYSRGSVQNYFLIAGSKLGYCRYN